MPIIEALTCPTCGAPVSVQGIDTLSMCVYCNGALRIHRPASGPPQIEADTSVSNEAIARIKELVVTGKRAEAVALHQAEAKCDRATSEAAIDAYVSRAVIRTLLATPLRGSGIVTYLGTVALTAGGVALGVTHTVSWWFLGLPVAFGALTVVIHFRRLLKTLRYLRASAGTATILRHALIGKERAVVSYRLLIEVGEPSGATFRTELPFAVREAKVSEIKEGHRFRVKYFPGDPSSVVFNGFFENDAGGQ